MKKHFLIAALLVIAISFESKAQQQSALGRFIVGTSPVTFTMGKTQTQQQYNDGNSGVQTDSTHSSTNSIASHINLFVGYFVTKNICAGLQFQKGTEFSPFFRYYLFCKNPDSAKFDFFIQANFTYDYSNTDHPYQDEVYPTEPQLPLENYTITTDYKSTATTFDFSVGIAGAWHFTRHWALEAEVGYAYISSMQNTSSYIETTGNINVGAPPNTNTEPALKNTSLTNEGALKLMLSYRL